MSSLCMTLYYYLKSYWPHILLFQLCDFYALPQSFSQWAHRCILHQVLHI